MKLDLSTRELHLRFVNCARLAYGWVEFSIFQEEERNRGELHLRFVNCARLVYGGSSLAYAMKRNARKESCIYGL